MVYTARLDTTAVVIDATGEIIGPDNAPAAWAAYQAWVTAGNTPAAAPAPPASAPTSVAIVSTGTPALSGTYAIDPLALITLNGEASYIAINGAFSSGISTLPWPDTSGALHTFASTTEFIAFASAIVKYVTQVTMAIQTSTALPSAPITIA